MSLFFVELGDEDIFFGAVRRGLDFLCLGFVSTFCSGTQRCIGTSLRGLILLLCCFAVAPADKLSTRGPGGLCFVHQVSPMHPCSAFAVLKSKPDAAWIRLTRSDRRAAYGVAQLAFKPVARSACFPVGVDEAPRSISHTGSSAVVRFRFKSLFSRYQFIIKMPGGIQSAQSSQREISVVQFLGKPYRQ